MTESFEKDYYGMLSLPAFLVTDHERLYTLSFWAKATSSEAGAATSGAPPRKSLPLAPPGPWRHHFFRNMSDSAGAELTAALMPRNEPRQWLLTPKAEWKRPNEHIVLKPIVPTHRYQR